MSVRAFLRPRTIETNNQQRMSMTYLVELEPGVWLTDGEGDPPRTLDAQHATAFPTFGEALAALDAARCFRSFINAHIHY